METKRHPQEKGHFITKDVITVGRRDTLLKYGIARVQNTVVWEKFGVKKFSSDATYDEN